MPRYEYECPKCNVVVEVDHPISQPPENLKCERCDSATMTKIISRTNFVLAGQGWARDGYSK